MSICAVEFVMDRRAVWFTREEFWTEYTNVTSSSFKRLLRAIEAAPVTAVLAPPPSAADSATDPVPGSVILGLSAERARRG